MKVYLSELAESKLFELSEYLITKWNKKTRDKFLLKFTEKINQVANHPESCVKSERFDGLYKCIVTKHNTFYYRISKDKREIEIITIFDTRQNENKLKKHINI